MSRARLQIALAASLVLLVVVGSGSAVAGSFSSGPLVQVSGASPIGACDGDDGNVGGTNFLDSEVEPWLSVDPSNPNVLIGAWQQDRWSNGGSEGLVSATSTNGGASWSVNSLTKSSTCTGGTAANGGNYERASDPWVAISPNGTAYLMSLSVNSNPGGLAAAYPSAMLVMRSTDHGQTWEDPVTLIRDESPNVLNDKNSITADPNDSRFVYAVWDRLVSPPSGTPNPQALENARAFGGDVYLARTTDGGSTWEPARKIFKAGIIAQTIGNLIVVLPDNAAFNGELVDVFTLLRGPKNEHGTRGVNIAAIRSADHGATWSKRETIISDFRRGIVVDPDDEKPHRTGDINPEVAVDTTTGALYVVWQDSRFGPRSSIALSQSLDGGRTWSSPIRVNQTPPPDPGEPAGNAQAFTPVVQVLNDGTVAVSYYDFRNNTSDDGATTPTDAFVVHCHANCSDPGSWGDETRVTDASFDSRKAPVARGFFLGDYEGLGSDGSAVFPFFAMSHGSDPASIFVRKVGP
ncbi:MAG TPA: sialidase family protein [Actinomycetes bacterium]|nr:sialidase family protein [Actinomycetes bacterium]